MPLRGTDEADLLTRTVEGSRLSEDRRRPLQGGTTTLHQVSLPRTTTRSRSHAVTDTFRQPLSVPCLLLLSLYTRVNTVPFN